MNICNLIGLIIVKLLHVISNLILSRIFPIIRVYNVMLIKLYQCKLQ